MKPSNWKKTIILFMAGQGITLLGSMLVYYAIMWQIVLGTQSGVVMTLVSAVGSLPMFFIAPFGGVWADRYNKKNIINIADAAIAAVTLTMAFLFSMNLEMTGLLLVCLAMRALGQGVQTPAVNALIPELVPQEHLARVNGISSSIQSLVMLTSPILGAALRFMFSIQSILYLDVVTAAIGIGILVFFVKVPARPQRVASAPGVKQYFHEIGAGLRYVVQRPFLKKFLLLSALFNIMIAPVAVMTPLQVTLDWGDGIWTILGGLSFGPEQRLAAVEIAFFVGMMLGGVVIGVWGGFKNKSHSMALSTFLLGVGSIGLGMLTNFWLYLLCTAFVGIVLNLFNAPMMTTLQTNVDSAYMGRVFSVLNMMSSVMMPLGMMLWGPLGDVVAIDVLLIVTGSVVFLMGFIFMLDQTLLKAGRTVQALPEQEGIVNVDV